jgi:multidrug resistance efflux pump
MSQAAEPARSRRVPLAVGVGLVLLTVTILGAGYELHTPGSATAQTDSGGPSRAVCFGHVDIKDGLTPLYPTQLGRVVAIHVKENDVVAEGTILFEVDARQARELETQARADLQAAKLQQEQARSLVEQHKQAVLAQEKVCLARREEAKAEESKARIARRQATANTIDDELAQGAEAAARARGLAADAEEAKLQALRAQRPDLEVQRADQDILVKEARLRTATLGVDECKVRAPVAGSVLRLNVNVGETLGSNPNPQRPPLLFCSSGPRYVRAEVAQEFASRVTLNQPAEIEDDTRSGQKWHGKVVRLSDWYSHRRSMLLEPLEYNDVRTLEALIEIDPSSPLRIGQRVRVTLEGK